MQTDQVSDAAAERQAGDARVAERSAGCRQPVPQAGRVEVLPERPATAGGNAGGLVDRDVAHQPKIDGKTPVADAMAGNAVAAAAHRDREVRLDREADRRDDIVDVEWPHHKLRPPVEHAVERRARGFEAVVVGSDDRTAVLPA